jgi:nicotinamide-nucleotide amidase
MKAYILTIGDEILIGQVTDTNATYMAAALTAEGVEVVEHLSVSDTRAGILSGLDRALAAADLVLITGGLGPTKDDITKVVLAEYYDTTLDFHQESWERLVEIYGRFGHKAIDIHRQQCFLPAAAEVLINKLGTAPGMLLQRDGKTVISMPGVPYEMRYLVEHEVMPRVRALGDLEVGRQLLRSVTILTAGAGESALAEMIESVENELPTHLSLAYLPNLGTVRLRLSARGTNEEILQADLEKYRVRIETIIGSYVYGPGNKTLAEAIGELINEESLTIGTVESCTGGRIAQMITVVPGASAYYHGSVVAYDNQVKEDVLGVSKKTLKKHGAVSEEVVREMITGGLKVLGTDIVVATTGVAGPGGGTEAKPVGTIWIAVGNKERTMTKLLSAGKDRERNITYTAFQALNLVRQFVD